MTALDRSIPFQLALTASEGIAQEGLVYKITSNALTIVTAKGDTAVGVADQALFDTEGNAITARSGQKVAVFLIGSSAIVNVASKISETWAIGAAVYLADDVDGAVTTSASTSRPIGHYVGDGEATTVSKQLIPVILDVPIGAATV